MTLPGRATPAGTAAFSAASKAAKGHFRALHGLALSSLGIGTYLGRDDAETDALYGEAVTRALGAGLNVIDTAINYRHQRSERAVGAALRVCGLPREQVFVATKGGFLAFDGARPRDPQAWLAQTLFAHGLATPNEIAAGCHCMTGRFLADQIDRSRANLELETIDLYYLHNPETQLGEVPREEFLIRLRGAFEALEGACAAGKIAAYGVATWSGLRLGVDEEEHLSLAELLACAREVGGAAHHFRGLQLPFNLEMDEAATLRNQRDAQGVEATILEAAAEAGLLVMASASVLQGRLTRQLPQAVREKLKGVGTDAQRALQFVRSTPGIATALVGMKSPAHVDENAALARVPPLEAGSGS